MIPLITHPKVSVVIPAYNHETFIGPAVDSVLQQSYANIELIVVDDGSTDRTGQVVQSYQDPRVIYFYQENQDAYNALNRGLDMATGKFVSILNSDDIYHPTRLERCLRVHRRTRAAAIFSDVQPIDAEGNPFRDPNFWWTQWHEHNRQYYFKHKDLYTAFLHGNFMVTTSNLFMTAQATNTVGKFASLRYLHDYDYIFRLMCAFPRKVVYLDREKLIYYRLHGGNTISDAAIKGREEDKQVIRKYLLKKMPGSLQALATTGIDRLVALENELVEVREQLKQQRNEA
jgi:glycosyltransferase involved in cell wall biosynthesis